jgi:hypothetical protein
MCTPRGAIAEFAKLEEAITRAGGAEGESAYQQILKRHGVEQPSGFKRSQQARVCAKEIFQAIERFQEISHSASSPHDTTAAPATNADPAGEKGVGGGQHAN